MVLAVAWQPNIHPIDRDSLGQDFKFRITDLRDEGGKPLNVDGLRDREGETSFTLDRSRVAVWRDVYDLAIPPAGVRRWSLVKGQVKLAFPKTVQQVMFGAPLNSSGKRFEFGGTSITLLSCQRAEHGVLAQVRVVSGRRADRGEVGLRSRWDESRIILRGRDGSTAPCEVRFSSSSSGDDNESDEVTGFFRLASEPDSLEFPFILEHFEHEVPFEFKDVELP